MAGTRSSPDGGEPERVVQQIADILAAGDGPAARRALMRAKDRAITPQECGAIFGCELVATGEDELGDPGALVGDLIDGGRELLYVNAVGGAISEIGETLPSTTLLLFAQRFYDAVCERFDSEILWANRALVEERLEWFSHAADSYVRAFELDPEWVAMRREAASCYRRAGELERAVEHYRAYLACEPDDAHEWIWLAIVLCDSGDYDGAQQTYWRAAALEPDNPSLHYNWLVTALRAGKLELAEDAARRLRSCDDRDWRNQMAEIHLLEARGQQVDACDRALALLDELAADVDEVDPREILSHVVGVAAAIAGGAGLTGRLEQLFERMFDLWIFPRSALGWLRQLEHPTKSRVKTYLVTVDALHRRGLQGDGDEPIAYCVSYRVYAESAERAGELACAFTRRCGADEVIAADVEQEEAPSGPRHPGVWWRSVALLGYPAEEFGG